MGKGKEMDGVRSRDGMGMGYGWGQNGERKLTGWDRTGWDGDGMGWDRMKVRTGWGRKQ